MAGDVLGDPAPFGFVHGIMRSWLGRGVARSNEDHVGAGRELLELHRRTGDAQFLDAARKLAALNAGFPAGPNGERYHRGDTPGWRWQIWVDCMDVDGPFLAALAHATGEDRYFDQAAGELLGYARTLQSDSGLLFHGFERDCGTKWRAVGARQWLGADGPGRHARSCCRAPIPRGAELQQRTVALADALAADTASQRAVAHGGQRSRDLSRIDARDDGRLCAARRHCTWRARRHRATTRWRRKARSAMHAQIAPDGTLQLVSDATPVGARAVYATRPFGTFPWGQGPLLLALCQEVE